MASLPSLSHRILAFDIGGTGLKAALIDSTGAMISERLTTPTPHQPTPQKLIEKLLEVSAPLRNQGGFDRIAVGFPGVIRHGVILTSPTLGNPKLNGFQLEGALAKKLKQPVRVVNDAEMQGFATIRGHGLELVITLGTGFGSALFSEGNATPHLELSTHGFRQNETYNQQLGNKALHRIGKKKWNRRVEKAIDSLFHLTHFDHLFIGGGNSAQITFDLPPHVTLTSNINGLKGGAWVGRPGEKAGVGRGTKKAVPKAKAGFSLTQSTAPNNGSKRPPGSTRTPRRRGGG